MIRMGIWILAACFVSGCAMPHPMGLTAEQWNALPPERQAELQAQQYAIDAEQRQQREAQRMEQERIAHEQAVARAEQIRQAYANARYGDVVNVVVQGGFIEWNRKRDPYEPVSFDLVKGETKPLISKAMVRKPSQPATMFGFQMMAIRSISMKTPASGRDGQHRRLRRVQLHRAPRRAKDEVHHQE